jgi:unsaturated rhamnogalacturonyl hydrolase
MLEMATSLNDLQQADGFWKSDLLDTAKFPIGKTSGTAFFCYGIAWGINHDVRDKKLLCLLLKKHGPL